MNSQTTTHAAADENAIRAIHQRMIDAWNAGDAAAFAAPFTDESLTPSSTLTFSGRSAELTGAYECNRRNRANLERLE